MENTSKILLVDDDKALLKTYQKLFTLKGFDMITCSSAPEALKLLKNNPVSVVITDVIMPKMDGMQLLREIKKQYSFVEVIMLTAEGSIADAVGAVKAGAFSYLVKPADIEEMMTSVKHAQKLANANSENERLKAQIETLSQKQEFIGSSSTAKELRETAQIVGRTDSTVLITGETGTGKEVIAKMVHENSNLSDKPLICVNCAALNENLIEAELFGVEKGAYTGADKRRKGRFELADGGTLFFDEIGELSMNMQAKLLRVLQEKSFERVGGSESIRSNFRLIAATNKNLKEEVQANRFRADLFYRLNIIPISVPPLRERRGDIREIAEAFLLSYSKEMNKQVPVLTPEILHALQQYSWPGNVRELKNIIERLVVLSSHGELKFSVLPEEITKGITDRGDDGGLKQFTKVQERELIVRTLEQNQGNIALTAKELGISARSLYRKLNDYEIIPQHRSNRH